MDNLVNIIKKAQSKSFSEDELLKLVDYKANLLSYPELSKYNNIFEAMGKHKALILIYLSKENYGHWVCVFEHKNGSIEFFDPYSMKPDDEIKYIPSNFRKISGQNVPHLTALLYNTGRQIIYNEYKLQKLVNDNNTCGRWVGMRLILRHLSIKQFAKLFMNKKIGSDFLVTLLTINY